MEKHEEQNLNIMLKAESLENNAIFSLHTLGRNIKKFFLPWLLTSVIACAGLVGFNIFFYSSSATPVEALVGFDYDGIDKGKFPDGTDFEFESLKSPKIISQALESLSLPAELVEPVRTGIIIDSIIPSDTMDRLTTYKSIFDAANSASLNAAEKMLDQSWHSTQYELKFDYRNAGVSRDDAAAILNAMTSSYSKWFYEQFGYNEALGNNLKEIDYTQYDYAEAIDMFDDNLITLNRYVTNLANDDTARFRSKETGLTFADLKSAIASLRELDLDILSSFISVNNVTKDKDRLLGYYEYRIENLSRDKIVYEETLNSIVESIDSYEKDQIIIFGNGTDTTNTQYTQASEQYDKLISQKISTQQTLSNTVQRIAFYEDRIEKMKTQIVGSTDKKKKTEEELEKLNAKIEDMTNKIETTANEYYMNYSLADAFSVLVPAASTSVTKITKGINRAVIPTIGIECVIFAVFLALIFLFSFREDNPEKKKETESVEAEDTAAEEAEETETEAEETTEKKAKSKK